MKAMILEKVGKLLENKTPLSLVEMAPPVPYGDDLLLKVSVCGVCHTELDEIEGRTPPSMLPMIPGHQVVGQVYGLGPEAHRYKIGDRVGVAWIFSACGVCRFCRKGYENLCQEFQATGRDAHLVMKLASHLYPDTGIYVFARSENEQAFARELGAVWAGNTHDTAPVKLDAIIDTTPAWKPVVEALGNLAAGGRLVINAIRKEGLDQNYLLKMDYPSHLWLEKEIKSVANVTRQDVEAFLTLATDMRIRPEVQDFSLEEANQALLELKERKIRGAKVLVM